MPLLVATGCADWVGIDPLGWITDGRVVVTVYDTAVLDAVVTGAFGRVAMDVGIFGRPPGG